MSAYTIAPAGIGDLPRIRQIAHDVWPGTYDALLGADRVQQMLAEIYALDTLAADIAERGHAYWIASNQSGDLGFASAYRDEGRVWVKKLYVRDSARGLGLGKGLIATASAHFGPDVPVALLVNNGNASAIAFYRAQGFAIEREVPVRMGPFDFTDYLMVRPAAQ